MLYHTIDTCGAIHSHIFTHAHAALFFFFKKHVLVKLTLFFDDLKNKPVQTKTIPFSESAFKKYVMLGRTLFLILLTLAVNIKVVLTFIVSFVLHSFLFHSIFSPKG